MSYQESTATPASTAARANELLRQAVVAARAGEKRQARNLLRELLEVCPDHEQGLLWAAALSETMDGAFWFLQRLLQVNPNNQQAANILAMHEARLALKSTPKPRATAPPAPAAAEQPAAHPAQPRRWQCPICCADAASAPRRCPRCRSIPLLTDLQTIARNEGVDEKLLMEALRDLQKKANTEPTFDSYVNLALVLLNLKRSAEALPWLRKAAEARPAESTVMMVAHLLEQRKLVLCVDDSQTVRRVVSLILEQNGYRTLTAADGMQALARINESLPDLILLDVSMPRMDGYQVCKTIKQNPYTKTIPILMLSGNDGFFDKIKGKLAGSTDYLTKPLDEDSLLQAVEKYLKVTAAASK
ncbi:MAG: response regulator [Bryobacteraceae bacterium]